MEDIKLSIVIPTKNRQQYCIAAVEQILSLKLDNTEIVIQDNSDDNRLEVFLKSYTKEGKLKYNYAEGVISFVDNFSAPLPLCRGKYVCMIGDDDGVLPNIISVVDYAQQNDYDAIIPGLNSVYFWPSSNPIIKNAQDGYMCLAYINNSIVEVNPENGLHQLMQTAGQKYQSLDLPRLYHGIVKREKIEVIKKMTGFYFDGLTPDIYMSVALSVVCKKVCRLGFPITISGICPHSGSSDSATGKHTGNLNEAPHFKGHKGYVWDSKAPAIYSVESIWAETVLHALHIFEREDLYNEFRVDILDGICYRKYPQFKDILKKHMRDYGIWELSSLLKAWTFFIIDYKKKFVRRLLRKKGDVIKLYSIPDIKNAAIITEKILGKR